MPRKVYDIVPPKVAHKIEKNIKEFLADEKPKKGRKSQPKKKAFPFWIKISIGAGVLVFGLAIILFFKLPKANIEIWPKVEVLSFKQDLTADKLATETDSSKYIIPAQYFEITKTASETFPATGNASDEGRAEGMITIFNKGTTSVTLKTGTHFLSDSEKYFVTLDKVVIPAGTKKGTKVTPGSINARVQAAEAGPSYNIAPANFSVPKLAGSAYYYNVYAISDADMTGGYTGKVKKVTEDDIQSAKDVLTKKATDDAQKELKNQIPEDYVMLDGAIITSVEKESTATKAGTVAENFQCESTVKATGFAFKKSDVEKIVKDNIASQAEAGKILLDSSLKIDYSAGTIDAKNGKITITVDSSSGIYKNLDKNSLALSLVGKNSAQINELVKSGFGDNVENINVKFWPFWVASAPKNQKRVNIELMFK